MDETAQPETAAESTAPAERGSVDEAVRGLLQMDEPKRPQRPETETEQPAAEAPEAEEPEAAPAAEEGAEAPAEAEDSTAGQADSPTAATLSPPRSWPKEDHAVFAALPPDAQAVIARRASEADRLLVTKANEVAAERQQIAAERERYAHGLAAVQQQMVRDPLLARTNAEWDALRNTDPVTWTIERAERQEKLDKYAVIAQENERIQRQAFDEQQQQHFDTLKTGLTKLQEYDKTWAKPEEFRKAQSEIRGYLESMGYEAAQIDTLSDYRSVIVADKARKYDRMMAKKPAVDNRQPQLAPTMPPAARSAPANQRERSMEQLRRSGDLNDAARAILGG